MALIAALLLAGGARVVLAAGESAGVDAAATAAARARRIEGLVIAPCCFTNTVATHDSEASRKVRREIEAMVAAGRPEAEILDSLVRTYGERILAAPPVRGFGLLAYLIPPVGLVVAAAGVLRFVRRGRRAPRRDDGEGLAVSRVDASLRARLSAELAELEQR